MEGETVKRLVEIERALSGLWRAVEGDPRINQPGIMTSPAPTRS
jgi:hypothetical protein